MYSVKFVLWRFLQRYLANLLCPIFIAFPWHLRAIHHLHHFIRQQPYFTYRSSGPLSKGLLCCSKTRHFLNRIILPPCCLIFFFFLNHRTFGYKEMWRSGDDIEITVHFSNPSSPSAVTQWINKQHKLDIFKACSRHEATEEVLIWIREKRSDLLCPGALPPSSAGCSPAWPWLRRKGFIYSWAKNLLWDLLYFLRLKCICLILNTSKKQNKALKTYNFSFNSS